MRISDIFTLGINALEVAIVILMFFLIIWGCGYKVIYQKILHGKKRLTIKKLIPNSLLCLVVLVILYATIFRENYWGGEPSLIPFSSYRLAWYQGNISEWRNLILNTCMFVPFGFVLPLTNKKLRKSWKVYLAGFAFSLIIEITQLILHRGLFEADDLINNLLGAMIGYGIYAIASSLYSRKVSKKMLYCQIPLVGVIVVGVVLSCIYNSQELGNVIYENISKHEMPKISFDENITMEDENTTANIYKTSILSEEETHQYVKKLFGLQEKKIDESRTDIYDETAVYYSDDGSISIWVDYKGGTLSYTNYDLLYPTDNSNCKYLLDAEEEVVQRAVKEIGLEIPENTIFYSTENKYTFEVKDDENGEAYYTGLLTCELNDEGKVVTLTSDIIRGELYKTVDIISPQRAFDLVSRGQFYSFEDNFSKNNSLILIEMNLTYICDSKGFYQPAYEFVLKNELGEEEKIYIMAKEG